MPQPDLGTLVSLFYGSQAELGRFESLSGEDVPEPYKQLLVHEHHMTVTVEAYHKSLVDVMVLDKRVTDTHYAREILLARQSDQQVVQYGIMRVNLSYLRDEVANEIRAEETPLGRILIQHDVHREIHLRQLWKVTAGKALQQLFGLSGPTVTYGRTAIIDCNDEPAIELLEIVTPAE